MKYCPYCSEPLPKPVKICPHCKRSLDLKLLSSLYQTDSESSEINKRIRRKIWFREKLIIILPVIALATGIVIGGIVMYSYAQIEFASAKENLENEIQSLQGTIEQQQQAAANAQVQSNEILNEKDQIIATLNEQSQILSRMIGFTNRLARNSTITPNSPQEIDYFQRNVRYLQSLFSQEQEKLAETSFTTDYNYNLYPVPQFLE